MDPSCYIYTSARYLGTLGWHSEWRYPACTRNIRPLPLRPEVVWIHGQRQMAELSPPDPTCMYHAPTPFRHEADVMWRVPVVRHLLSSTYIVWVYVVLRHRPAPGVPAVQHVRLIVSFPVFGRLIVLPRLAHSTWEEDMASNDRKEDGRWEMGQIGARRSGPNAGVCMGPWRPQ